MIISSVSQGLLYGILGIGIYLTFRILNFPDMTTEGSFPLGAAVTVTLLNQNSHPIIATLAGVLAGALAGLITGLLHTKGGIPTILSGILVMTSMNSMMLMIMGRANLGLNGKMTLFMLLPFDKDTAVVLLGVLVLILVVASLIFVLNTRLGQAYIVTGDNPEMAKSFGINTSQMTILGLMLSNALIALSGSLVAQQDGFADVSKGIGVIVIGISSIIIGEVLYHNLTLLERLLAIVVGAVIYWALITGIIALGFSTSYLKLYSSLVLAVCLVFPKLNVQLAKRR